MWSTGFFAVTVNFINRRKRNGKIFKDMIIISGDKLDEYLKALQESEKARAPFKRYLESLKKKFAEHLLEKYSHRTVSKHISIVEMFVVFLRDYTDVERIEDIAKVIANSELRDWYKRKV
jgi:hypothetical protein